MTDEGIGYNDVKLHYNELAKTEMPTTIWDISRPFDPTLRPADAKYDTEFYMQCPEGQHVHIRTAAFAKKKDGDNVSVTLEAKHVGVEESKITDDMFGVRKRQKVLAPVRRRRIQESNFTRFFEFEQLESYDIGAEARHFNGWHLDDARTYKDPKGKTAKAHELMFIITVHCRNVFSGCDTHSRYEWECVDNNKSTQNVSSDTDGHRMHFGVISAIAALIGIWIA